MEKPKRKRSERDELNKTPYIDTDIREIQRKKMVSIYRSMGEITHIFDSFSCNFGGEMNYMKLIVLESESNMKIIKFSQQHILQKVGTHRCICD